ncbi:SGNH/GDSL hydrolase family protein [Lacinutrix cladophorae]
MKFLRLLSINALVLLLLLSIVGTVAYYSQVRRIKTFFKLTGENHVAYLQYDSTAMFVHKPNIKVYENWGKPNQKFNGERRTNNLGFREDHDILEKKENEYRILVTGDSHTDGALRYNNQSFINVWEKHLNKADSATIYNGINGGTAYYTFRNYLGFIKKYSYLKPDIYLINIFTGNDFRETFLYEDNRTSFNTIYKNLNLRLKKRILAIGAKQFPLTQGIDQTLYFKSFPTDKEKALVIAKKYLLAIKQLCEKENIRLIVTLLPSKTETNASFKEEIKANYTISEKDINTNLHITNSLITWLNTEAIENFNLTPVLKQANEKVFWDHDLHINDNGHRIIGEYLFNKVIIEN